MYIRFALIIILCSDLQPEDPVYLSNQDQSTDVTFYEQVSNYLCNFTNQKNIFETTTTKATFIGKLTELKQL
jgi:hypothetical protein